MATLSEELENANELSNRLNQLKESL